MSDRAVSMCPDRGRLRSDGCQTAQSGGRSGLAQHERSLVSDLDVVAVIEAKPGSEGAVKAALQDLVTATRAEEGCISYDLKVAADKPTTFLTIEKWRSQADLDGHMKSAHIATAFEVAGEHMAGQPGIYPLADV